MNLSALHTDLYQLTMANGYFKLGMHDTQACFYQFFRRNPFGSGYTISAGLEDVIHYLENFHFSDSDIGYLASLNTSSTKLFDRSFLDYLKGLELCVRVEAVEEGTVLFPMEPMLRVTGPILQCQILESAILNITNFQSLVATKASRCASAAKGKEVIDFGLRRAQGPDGALSASRAAYIGGCASTSNVLAAKNFGIPVKGTLAHSWIMAFEDEKKAFESFTSTMPESTVLLVDTYRTLSGLRTAIEVGLDLKRKGRKLIGVRLDSGDFCELSKQARKMLDEAGLQETQIVVSGDLDEYRIRDLVQAKAPIDVFGVGTRLVTAYDEPALGGVYKLSAIKEQGVWKNRVKISDDINKSSLPGLLQTRRYFHDGMILGDLVYNENMSSDPSFPLEGIRGANHVELLRKAFCKGARVCEKEPLSHIQKRVQNSLGSLRESVLDFATPEKIPVWIDSRLQDSQDWVLREGESDD